MTANFCSSSICQQENGYPGFCFSVEIAADCGRGLFATACESEARSIAERVNNYPTVKHENRQLAEELEKAKRQIKRLRDKLKAATRGTK